MLCTACTSAVVGSAAVEISLYAEALKTNLLAITCTADLRLFVVPYSVQFYLLCG